MAGQTKRPTREGFGFGVLAGILFAVVQVLGSLAMGMSPLLPFRFAASIVLGSSALIEVSPAVAVIVGGLVHLLLSGLFGMLYAAWNAGLSLRTQTDFAKEAGLGALFGVLLWLVNYQIIARILYRWYLDTPQFFQMLIHALAYGLPLGLMYARLERRLHPVVAGAATGRV